MKHSNARLVDLIDAVADGDRPALAQIYKSHSAALYGIVLRILRAPELAAEALRDAFLAIWREAASFDAGQTDPELFLAATTRRVALDIARARSDDHYQRNEPAGAEQPAAAATPAAMSEDLQRLLAVLGGLSADLRRMLLLAYYDGWSRRALAVEFDAAPETIGTWLRRSLGQLRDELE